MNTIIDSTDFYHNNRGTVALAIAEGNEPITCFEDNYTFFCHAIADQYYLIVCFGKHSPAIYVEVREEIAEMLIRLHTLDAIRLMFNKANELQHLF